MSAISVPRFERNAPPATVCDRIGNGELGGKASGLARMQRAIASRFGGGAAREIAVSIPRMTVITTEHFAAFLRDNHIVAEALAALPDDRIAGLFQRGELPAELLGDLWALIAATHTPLAVRSSSLLEDAVEHPFAGVYATKMTPNNQLDADSRFRRLVEAIKLVYASTFFRRARAYRAAVGARDEDERMAVILQEIVGRRYGDRFYPTVSGVARSFNFYPSGNARPEDGVVELALGLGKTIVDGEASWSYCPAYPRTPRPYTSLPELLKSTQTRFWAVTMGRPPAYDPLKETEYLIRCELTDAEADGALRFVASTYDPGTNRIVPGVGRKGPRLVDFAPVLAHGLLPFNDTLKELMALCEQEYGGPVEVELAATLDVPRDEPARLGFLQVRGLVVFAGAVEVADEEMRSRLALVASDTVLGNGLVDDLTDIVYMRPERFSPAAAPAIAEELEEINRALAAAGRRYVLLGPGRWGTSDPGWGVPVGWGQISGARVIVESALPGQSAELSQGSHFFHNVTSFRVLYFSVGPDAVTPVDWGWLDRQPAARETPHIRHLRLARGLTAKVDGRRGRGVLLRHG